MQRALRCLFEQSSLIFTLAATALLLHAPADEAQFSLGHTYPAGCYYCEQTTFLAQDCVTPAQNGQGDGIYCKLQTIFLSTVCQTSGGACLYYETGGGTSSGGGSSSCDTSASLDVRLPTADDACPPDCFGCGGLYY